MKTPVSHLPGAAGRVKTISLMAIFSLAVTVLPACSGSLKKVTDNLNTVGISVPGTSASADSKIDVKSERRIGLNVAAKLLGAMPLVDDDKLQTYVNQVGFLVAQHSSRPNLNWNFAVLDSQSINAFAAPGGIVFITRGLFMQMRNEAELACVLGHEIAHIAERHHLNALRNSQLSRDAVDWVAKAIDAEDSETYKTISGSITDILLSGLDQSAESEADRVGVVLAARAGYDPFSLLTVLTTLSGAEPDEVTMQMFTATHPRLNSRIDSLDISMGDRFDSLYDQSVLENRFYSYKKRLADL